MKIELEGEKEKKWEKCKEERKSIKERSDLYGIEIESSGALKTNGMDCKMNHVFNEQNETSMLKNMILLCNYASETLQVFYLCGFS